MLTRIGASTKVDDRSRRRALQLCVEPVHLLASTKVDDRSRRRWSLSRGVVVVSRCLNEGRRPKSSTASDRRVSSWISPPQRRSTTEVVDGLFGFFRRLGGLHVPQRRSTTEVVDGRRVLRQALRPQPCLNEGRRPKSSTVHGHQEPLADRVEGLNEGRRPKSSTVIQDFSFSTLEMPQRRSTTEVVDGSAAVSVMVLCVLRSLNEGRRPKSSTAVDECQRHASQLSLNEGRRPKSSTAQFRASVTRRRYRVPQRRSTTEVVDGVGGGARPSMVVPPQRRSTTEVVDGLNTQSGGITSHLPQRRSTTEVVDG